MLKYAYAAAAITAILAVVPAQAQTKMECTAADMAKMDTQMKAMTDKSKQDMAMKEMKMADDMMKKNDMKNCQMHMDNAVKEMDGKK